MTGGFIPYKQIKVVILNLIRVNLDFFFKIKHCIMKKIRKYFCLEGCISNYWSRRYQMFFYLEDQGKLQCLLKRDLSFVLFCS